MSEPREPWPIGPASPALEFAVIAAFCLLVTGAVIAMLVVE